MPRCYRFHKKDQIRRDWKKEGEEEEMTAKQNSLLEGMKYKSRLAMLESMNCMVFDSAKHPIGDQENIGSYVSLVKRISAGHTVTVPECALKGLRKK